MFAGSLVLGLTMIVFAVWLQWNESFGWTHEPMTCKADVEYLLRRSKSRSRIHLMIGFCGSLAIVAAFSGAGSSIWVAAWMSIMLALLVIIGLAFLDAWHTYRHQVNRRAELTERSLTERSFGE